MQPEISVLSRIRNVAIVAHADAGKTTLTEQFLYLAGRIKQPGSVDHGTAQTDFLPVEKERGISVRSAGTSFVYQGVRVNLVDTPGHVDFSAEVERALRIPDGVILVISAVEGVQAHTVTLWRALKAAAIPVMFFINKIDRIGADSDHVLATIVKELGVTPLCLQKIEGEGGNDATVIPVWAPDAMPGGLVEQLVATDDTLMESYLSGATPGFATLDQQLAAQVKRCDIYPLLFGSAKLGLGTRELLEAVLRYFSGPHGDPSDELSALVYAVSHDRTMGKVAHVKVFRGVISNRDVIMNVTRGMEEKVTQVRRMAAGRFEDTGRVEAGDLAGLCGLQGVAVGDVLGKEHPSIPGGISLSSPLLTVRVRPETERDLPALAEAMSELAAEDPSLGFEWLREEGEIHIRIMGWIQMEILERILMDRFNIRARLENPTVIYRETPSQAGVGFVQYWMPKPCWAILKFSIEPGERGSGVSYRSEVPVNDVLQKYQHEVERTIETALRQGPKGWEVTDLSITLIEGEDHPVHSRPGDFTVATPMGIMHGLVNTGTTLLEPVLSFKIEAAEELLGAVTSDITRMRGSFDSPEMNNGTFMLTGIMPMASSLDYPVRLSSRSGGKARIATAFYGYSACPDELGVIRPYRGISPLDTAKYILKARKALQ